MPHHQKKHMYTPVNSNLPIWCCIMWDTWFWCQMKTAFLCLTHQRSFHLGNSFLNSFLIFLLCCFRGVGESSGASPSCTHVKAGSGHFRGTARNSFLYCLQTRRSLAKSPSFVPPPDAQPWTLGLRTTIGGCKGRIPFWLTGNSDPCTDSGVISTVEAERASQPTLFCWDLSQRRIPHWWHLVTFYRTPSTSPQVCILEILGQVTSHSNGLHTWISDPPKEGNSMLRVCNRTWKL